MPEAPVLRDDYGRKLHVGRTQDGEFCVSITDKLTCVMAVLSGERLDAFTGAVDREAMPGQVPPLADEAGTGKTTEAPGPTAEQVRRCGDSEDPFHRCPACYDYAAERDRTLAELKDERSFAASAVQAARDAREAWNDPDDHPF